MRNTFAAVLLAAATAAPAFAQEGAPLPFAGGHVEAIGGVDRVRANGSGETGVTYGVAGGYDVQTQSGTVFGVEGEFAGSSADGCVRGTLVPADRLCANAKRDLYAGGRIGFTSGSTLIYAKAGYTNFRIGASYEDGTAATASDFSINSNLDGVRVGGGLEKNLGNISLKAEYRYSNYQDGVTRHQGVIGAGVRF